MAAGRNGAAAARRSHLANALAIFTRETIEAWAGAHPEERIGGMGAVIESENLRGREKEPVCRRRN